MNKIITSFEKYNESKHANVFAEAKESADGNKEFINKAKKTLAEAKKLNLNKAETRSYLPQLKEHIAELSASIKSGEKSPIEHSLKKLEKTIDKCNFK